MIEILERRGLERQRRVERIAEQFAKNHVATERKYRPERDRKEQEIKEEARAKLERRGFFKRD